MCPDCQEALLILELEGIEVDHCLNCGGTWLDAGELEIIGELSGAAPGKMSSLLDESQASHKSEKRRCPRCKSRLEVITIDDGEPEPIELDRCPRGHGLWLDRGETLQVIRTFSEKKDNAEECVVARFFADIYKTENRAE